MKKLSTQFLAFFLLLSLATNINAIVVPKSLIHGMLSNIKRYEDILAQKFGVIGAKVFDECIESNMIVKQAFFPKIINMDDNISAKQLMKGMDDFGSLILDEKDIKEFQVAKVLLSKDMDELSNAQISQAHNTLYKMIAKYSNVPGLDFDICPHCINDQLSKFGFIYRLQKIKNVFITNAIKETKMPIHNLKRLTTRVRSEYDALFMEMKGNFKSLTALDASYFTKEENSDKYKTMGIFFSMLKSKDPDTHNLAKQLATISINEKNQLDIFSIHEVVSAIIGTNPNTEKGTKFIKGWRDLVDNMIAELYPNGKRSTKTARDAFENALLSMCEKHNTDDCLDTVRMLRENKCFF